MTRAPVMCVILPLLGCNNAALAPAPPLPDLTAPGNDDLAVADLSTPPEPDLSVPDLAMSPDLLLAPWTPVDPASYCGGPDGGLGCAEDFFARFANCYAPAGHCVVNAGQSGGMQCYESGAGSNWANFIPSGRAATYFHGDMLCAIVETMSMQGPFKWTLYDGTTLYEDYASGAATCEDGSHADFRGCADLDALLAVFPCPVLPWGTFPCPLPTFPSPSPSP